MRGIDIGSGGGEVTKKAMGEGLLLSDSHSLKVGHNEKSRRKTAG